MRVALYARVSTERQEREQTIGSQVEALEARAAAQGWAAGLSCADDGHTGTRLDRPGLDQVRDAAAARRIDAVVALCPDRLARNYVHQALVLEELARFGVSVIFLEGGHADDPHGRLLAQIQAAVAEFERTKIVDRNRRGKLWRARQGEVVSGAVPYGYRKVRATPGLPGQVEVCEEEATVVRQAFDWHANEGLSIRQIAIRLIEAGIPSPKGKPIWHPATVDALLRQEAYAGTLCYNRRITRADAPRLPRHSADHQPLTGTRPREEWIGIAVPPLAGLGTRSRSQAQHSRNTRFSPRHAGPGRYLLRHLVHCHECGQVRQAHRRAKPNGNTATTAARQRCQCTCGPRSCAAHNPPHAPTNSRAPLERGRPSPRPPRADPARLRHARRQHADHRRHPPAHRPALPANPPHRRLPGRSDLTARPRNTQKAHHRSHRRTRAASPARRAPPPQPSRTQTAHQ